MGIGATIGCILAGSSMTFLGRRGSTLILTVPSYFIGFVLIGAAVDFIMVIAGSFQQTSKFECAHED